IMPGLIGYPSMWLHQQQVFESVKAGEHVLVATGTGSGKTESFLYPIIDDLHRQRDQGTYEGLTAILVYPMNAPGQRPVGPAPGHAGRHGNHLRPVGRHDSGNRG
ncbi:MAG TPA: DEAD/DEAH box helicase, partial [Isosphaeraceae bacterium]|nr:DEAD/DEAH box helicase [Isosphaeraceae bacterium]